MTDDNAFDPAVGPTPLRVVLGKKEAKTAQFSELPRIATVIVFILVATGVHWGLARLPLAYWPLVGLVAEVVSFSGLTVGLVVAGIFDRMCLLEQQGGIRKVRFVSVVRGEESYRSADASIALELDDGIYDGSGLTLCAFETKATEYRTKSYGTKQVPARYELFLRTGERELVELPCSLLRLSTRDDLLSKLRSIDALVQLTVVPAPPSTRLFAFAVLVTVLWPVLGAWFFRDGHRAPIVLVPCISVVSSALWGMYRTFDRISGDRDTLRAFDAVPYRPQRRILSAAAAFSIVVLVHGAIFVALELLALRPDAK